MISGLLLFLLGVLLGSAGLQQAFRRFRRNRAQRRAYRDQPFDDGHYDFLDLD